MLRSLLALLALTTAAPAAGQTTWFVDVSAPGPGAGTQQDPYPSIQQAIDAPATADGDELRIAAGAYLESLDLGGKTLRLVGDAASLPIVRGNGLDRLLRVTSGEGPGTAFESLSFVGGTGGSSGFQGGAVLIESSTAAFTGCRFFANRICGLGGAVAAIQADVAFTACVFEENRAQGGGGIRAEGGTVIVRDCLFEGNEAGDVLGCSSSSAIGGGLSTQNTLIDCRDNTFVGNRGRTGCGAHLEGGLAGSVVERCHFEQNGAVPPVGAVPFIRGGALCAPQFTVRDCTFLSNGARLGGAVYRGAYEDCYFEGNTANQGGAAFEAALRDCVLVDNHALEFNANAPEGGGSHSSSQVRCVFVGNSAALGAGACDNASGVDRCTIVGNRGYSDALAVRGASVTNSIVWDNESVSPVGPLVQVDANVVAFSIVEGDPGSIPGPPLLFGRRVGDMRLLPGSPAIDAASGALPPDPDGSPADIGARTFDPADRGGPSRFCDAKPTAAGCLPEIAMVGAPSVSGAPARVEARDVPPTTAGILLLSADAQGVPFFGGTLCVGGSIVRSGVAAALPSSGCGDRLEFDLGPAQVGAVGVAPGDLLFAQVWFRDALNPDGTGIGITDAIVATVAP
ncbi:MAG: right-handed parallel beta-helix repeat-containing protein [Planctomycetota bacterium]